MTNTHSHIKGLSKHFSKMLTLFDITSFYTDASSSNERTVNVLLNLMIYIPLIIAAIYSFAKVYEFTYPTPEKVKTDRMEHLKKQFHKKIEEEETSFFAELKGALGSLSFLTAPLGYIMNIFKNIFLWLWHNPFRTLMVLSLALYLGLSFYFTSLYKTHFALKKWSSYTNTIIITCGIMLAVAVFTLFSDKGYVSIAKKPRSLEEKDTMTHEFGWMLSNSLGYYKSILLVIIAMCIPLFILWLIKTFSFLSTAASILVGLGVGAGLLYFANKEYSSSSTNKDKIWIKEHANLFKPDYEAVTAANAAAKAAEGRAGKERGLRKFLSRARSSVDRKNWQKAKRRSADLIEDAKDEAGWLEQYQRCLMSIIKLNKEKVVSAKKDVEDNIRSGSQAAIETAQQQLKKSEDNVNKMPASFADLPNKQIGVCEKLAEKFTEYKKKQDATTLAKLYDQQRWYDADRWKKTSAMEKDLREESLYIRKQINKYKEVIKKQDPDISFKEWVKKQAEIEQTNKDNEKVAQQGLFRRGGGAGGGGGGVSQVGGNLVVDAKPLRNRLQEVNKTKKQEDNLDWVILRRISGKNPTSEERKRAKDISNYIRLHWYRTEMEHPETKAKYIRYESDEDESLFTRIFKALSRLPTIFMDTVDNISSIPTWAWIILFIEIIAIIAYFILPLVPKFL